MDTKKYQKLKKKCNEIENDLNSALEALSSEIQPYFNHEITVFHQPSDGLVVLIIDDALRPFEAPENTPIDEVFNNIQTDPNFYKS